MKYSIELLCGANYHRTKKGSDFSVNSRHHKGLDYLTSLQSSCAKDSYFKRSSTNYFKPFFIFTPHDIISIA
jgi:hypothetical protein